jgi:hypothetical protein
MLVGKLPLVPVSGHVGGLLVHEHDVILLDAALLNSGDNAPKLVSNGFGDSLEGWISGMFHGDSGVNPSTQLFEPGCCRTPPPSSRRQRRAPRARTRGIGAIKVYASVLQISDQWSMTP